ncbi:DNA-binding response regulator [Taibaiella sp. KBW10]|uniref:response regulator transcription factor n=1 Tax=Taibaiella sp. KBW10 TaxID=2153357 RepID=UPI000F5AD6FC|nr:response regulator transcription factor [Taibaiella sp. KBW10]RQO31676.1 DNA-binding response regulator [Taibaiella sp. KBW10]
MSLKIIIADDHSVVRYGISQIAKSVYPDAEITFAVDFGSMLEETTKVQPALIICDINMPGCDSFNLVKNIKAESDTAKILVFSAYSEELYAPRFLLEGADGYLHKDADLATIRTALRDIMDKGRFISPAMTEYFLDASLSKKRVGANPLKLLSNREMEVASLLSQGLGLLEISNTLTLHSSTVSTYKNRVFEKLNISNIPELLNIIRTYHSLELL